MENLKNTDKNSENVEKELRISDVIKSLPNVGSLAEKYADREFGYVLKCRKEEESIAHLGLYLGFIEGYNYLVEQLKRGNIL